MLLKCGYFLIELKLIIQIEDGVNLNFELWQFGAKIEISDDSGHWYWWTRGAENINSLKWDFIDDSSSLDWWSEEWFLSMNFK